jgi:hypothetical protein
MNPVVITKALTAASANAIALSQTPGAAGNLTINGASASGGVATLDTTRRVIITSAGNDTGRTFTVYGTSHSNNPYSEAVTGASGAAATTVGDFITVTRVSVDAATAGAVTVGTSSIGSTPWRNPSISLTPFALDIECSVTGSATYSLEYTLSDYFSPASWYHGPADTVRVRPTAVTGAAGASSLTLTNPVRGWRVTILTGTGTVTTEAVQAGIANY